MTNPTLFKLFQVLGALMAALAPVIVEAASSQGGTIHKAVGALYTIAIIGGLALFTHLMVKRYRRMDPHET